MEHLVLLLSEVPKVEVPAFLENPWVLALLGWILYNFGKLFFDQKKYDLNNDGFISLEEVWMYIKLNWLGMVFSLILLVFVVPYTHNLWHWGMDLWGKDWEFSKIAYGLIGILMIFLQIGIKYVKDKFSPK